MDETPQMTIGEAASRSGVVGRLSFIRVAQQAGLSLDEIKRLVADVDEGTALSEPIRSVSAGKLPEIEAMIERATAMKGWDAEQALAVVHVPGASCRREPSAQGAPTRRAGS